MMGDFEQVDQQVIHNNQEIFGRIEKELLSAQSEILVAAAWFTDEVLLNILLRKAAEGIKVEIIIADNKENEKLDFQQLVLKGASVLKIKNVGYGMMHQKFCVIDKKVALHGSFNWSVNAKKNNHESIIATNHKGTVDSLVANFHDIKRKAFDLKVEPEKQDLKSMLKSMFGKKKEVVTDTTFQHSAQPSTPQGNTVESNVLEVIVPADNRTEYEKVLDSMIAAEVSNFDRGLLRQQGFDRAKANNGDYQVLNTALDSVYSVFINDINVVEDKKVRLITKIEEQKVKSINALKESQELKLNTIEAESSINKENITTKIANLKSQISLNDKEIDGVKQIKVPAIEEKIRGLEDKIRIAERDFVKPALKLFELIPVGILNLGLLLYLGMFYSSAAYILLFSELDAKSAQMANIPLKPAEVFNPDSFALAMDKGWAAIFFISLFVFLPLAFSLAGRFTTKKWLSYTGMGLIDVAIAYKVAQAVHTVNYMSGTENAIWKPWMVFQDANFYLVFIMGAGGLIFFSYTYNKFISYFEERNPDLNVLKSQVYVEQLKQDVQVQKEAMAVLREQIENFEKDSIHCRTEILICQTELEILPGKKLGIIEKTKSEFAHKINNIEITTDIYKSHIQNDNLPISIDSMKDRINIFLEGWNDFLHHEYSISKATEKSALAAQAIIEWQNEKLNNSLDKRIKT